MSKFRPMPPEEAELIRRVLSYDPTTGEFSYAIDRRGSMKAGAPVGTKTDRGGYLLICVGGRRYLAHRLAWLLVYGDWPELQIDHIDHDRANNRIFNLRLVTAQGNKMNETLRQDNKSGATGVFWNNRLSKWNAYLYQGRKRIDLGNFQNKDEAIAARANANDNYGFHENHGKPRAKGAA